ncbi:unnamed protein product [Ixodes pacificus]
MELSDLRQEFRHLERRLQEFESHCMSQEEQMNKLQASTGT